MLKKTAVVLLMFASVATVAALGAHDPYILARFDGGIGVITVSGVAQPANPDGTFANVTRNVVRTINPAGGPWRIGDLKATIFADGRIRVRGSGLLLASGDKIGQNANQRVFATLICEAAAPFVQHNSDIAGVALELDGDFRIDDQLSEPLSGCASPVLLIRASGSGVWFAAGIQKFSEDDN
jgi:hypothetical protein